MKNLRILSIILGLLIFSLEAHAQNGKIQLLETGEFHGDEVSAKTGETWLGLFKTGDGFSMLETIIDVETVHDVIVDEPGEKTGKAVKASNQNEAVFLIKGANFLPQGNVAVLSGEAKNINGKFNSSFKFKEDVYRLSVDNAQNKDEMLGKNAKLILTVNGRKQVLRNLTNGGNDAFWTLYWVGDLDADGKLDFYIDLTDHYNVADKRLFLSSQAKNGRLVGEVASFVTVGC